MAVGGLTVQGLPLIKPPYGTISAINLDKGEIVWQIPHGETPDAIRNNPALKGLNIPRTGQSTYNVGTLVTKTLVIAGDGQVTTTPEHPRGAMLRAYDKSHRQRGRRGLHAGAAKRIADDLHGERQAVHHRRRQRRRLLGRVYCVHFAGCSVDGSRRRPNGYFSPTTSRRSLSLERKQALGLRPLVHTRSDGW